jgi:hypothetical protein
MIHKEGVLNIAVLADGFSNGTKSEIVLRKERIPRVYGKVSGQGLNSFLPFPGKEYPFIPHKSKEQETNDHEQENGKGNRDLPAERKSGGFMPTTKGSDFIGKPGRK